MTALSLMSDYAGLLAALVAASLVVGFLSGLLGIGGGAILVPILYEVFHRTGVEESVLMQVTLGTSFAVVLPTALRSFQAHRSRGVVDEAALRRLAPFVFAGVLLGVSLLTVVNGAALKVIWTVCAVALACKMMFAGNSQQTPNVLSINGLVKAAALIIGALSTLMSVGGGIFFVSMFSMLGWPMLKAVATSSGFGPVIAIPALLGYIYAGFGSSDLPAYSLGYVNYLAAAIIAPLSVLTAPLGVRVAHRIPQRALELAFACFLVISGMRLLLSLL